MKDKKFNIAVVGATGTVGGHILDILEERNFPVDNVYAIASSDSIGKKVSFGDNVLKVNDLPNFDFSKVDIAFFCAGSKISKEYAEKATKSGAIVIDKSSFFRDDKDVPLIVPESNIQDLKNYTKKSIVASPNCCAIPLAVILKPLDNAVRIKRLVISTYQSASGAGKAGMDELYNQTKAKYVFEDLKPKIFPNPIAFNLFPYIGEFNEDGTTTEESKIANEISKIFGRKVDSSICCVRVPVFVGHSMSVNVEFEGDMNALDVYELLSEIDEIVTLSDSSSERYTTPIDVVGEDSVYVSRIRNDYSRANTINLWVVSDNLRKGAALNAVQIAEAIIRG